MFLYSLIFLYREHIGNLKIVINLSKWEHRMSLGQLPYTSNSNFPTFVVEPLDTRIYSLALQHLSGLSGGSEGLTGKRWDWNRSQHCLSHFLAQSHFHPPKIPTKKSTTGYRKLNIQMIPLIFRFSFICKWVLYMSFYFTTCFLHLPVHHNHLFK